MRGKFVDLEGLRFGRLEVKSRSSIKYRSHVKWICLCECGKTVEVRSESLKSGNTTSCGCLGIEIRRQPPGEASLNWWEGKYKISARKRKIEYALSSTEFREIVQSPCGWCGASPKPKNVYLNADHAPTRVGKKLPPGSISRATVHVNGVDRIYNDRGYFPGNCLPCCDTCNFAKNNMTPEEFVDWIYRVHSRLEAGTKEMEIPRE